MNNYPKRLTPRGNDTYEKEAFATWWARAEGEFQGVPRSVARQWIFNHWNHSPYGWLPSAGASFRLDHWQSEQVEALAIWNVDDPEEYPAWGDSLLDLARRPKGIRYGVAEIMARRGEWPAPPIILDHRRELPFPDRPDGLPAGFVLVEGNRRTAMAKALARKGRLRPNLPVWILSY
jgi:hypothetical protein